MKSKILTFVVCLALTSPALSQNLINNAGFETAEEGRPAAWHVTNSSVVQLIDQNAAEGTSCLSLTAPEDKGYVTTFAHQSVALPTGDYSAMRLEGRIRVQPEEAADAFGYLELDFVPRLDSGRQGFRVFKTKNVTSDAKTWQRVSFDIPLPPDAASMMVKCVVRGKGQVLFDDLKLTGITQKQLEPIRLVEADSRFVVLAEASEDESPWMSVSVPFPFEKQTPLAIRVETEPPNVVRHLRFLQDQDNRPLKITFEKLQPGSKVHLRVKTLVCLRNRQTSNGKGVPLPKKETIAAHSGVQQHLLAAPGIEIEDTQIVAIANDFDRTDLASLVGDLQTFLRENLTYAADKTQGAKDCIESKQGVCTGYANVAAALLRVNDVPTRILACLIPDGRLQEHYIVEAWTEQLGWSRIESTSAVFPWDDSENVILRIVYPEAPRTDYFAPLYWKLGGGLTGGNRGGVFDISRENGWSCQFTRHLGDIGVDSAFAEAMEVHARKQLDHHLRQSAKGSSVTLVDSAQLGQHASASEDTLELIESWLEGKQ